MIRTVTLRDSYDLYKRSVNNPVDKKTYWKISGGIVKFKVDKMFEGHSVKLSSGNTLGTIFIVGEKISPYIGKDGDIRGLAPNWPATKKLWEENPEAKAKKQLVFHFNEATNGIRYKFVWSRFGVKITNKFFYFIKFTKNNRTRLNKAVLAGTEYRILEGISTNKSKVKENLNNNIKDIDDGNSERKIEDLWK